jgi:hypothetical protein
MGPRAGLDNVEKRQFFLLPGLELRPLGRPARSQLLYRFSYSGSFQTWRGHAKILRRMDKTRKTILHLKMCQFIRGAELFLRS